MSNKIFAIGDVHGRFDLLQKLSVNIMDESNPGDTIVFLGDYVDRGMQSQQVIDFLMKDPFPDRKLVCLKGNHEDMMLDSCNGDYYMTQSWMINGGDKTLLSYNQKVPQSHINFISNMSLTYHEKNYFFCHAGVQPAISLFSQNRETLLWMRSDDFFNFDGKFLDGNGEKSNYIVVHGHTPQKGIVDITSNRINVDTGAYWTDVLSCVVLSNDEPMVVIST